MLPFSSGKRETHKQNSQEISGKGRGSPGIIPGQSREHFVDVVSCLLAFAGPIILQLHTYQLHSFKGRGMNLCNASVSLVSAFLASMICQKGTYTTVSK